ncbi:lipopolysaccharide biosynthesis protein [Phenylobacterium sp.]|uniref:lipopolysaccharide biosynthesis protein n=1 Tax=Phenylobacterium sp. TaxID=1871053 RepID=UPI002F954A61
MTAAEQAGPGRRALLHRTSLGALALTGASAIRLMVQFAMLPLLARLIGPSEYGMVALAMPFILLANVLSDGGMGYALGRQRDVTREQEATVFWLSGAIGFALMLFCIAAAWPMGAILNQPRLPWLIVALSPILLMNSLTTVANGRIIRGGRFSVFAAGDLISTFASAIAALAAALSGWGAWSLVAQQLVLWACKLVWVSQAGGTVVAWHYKFEEAKGLLAFGLHTIGAILADFVSRNLDSLIIGGVLGATLVGYYAMGYQIVRVPDQLISGPFYLYIFTAIARATHDAGARAVQDLAVAALRIGSAALAPLFCGLALTADLAVPLVLGDKWHGAITPLQHLAAAGFFFCMCSIMATTLMGHGKSGLRLRLSILLGVVVISSVAATVRFGLDIVSAAVALAMGAVACTYIHVLGRDLKMSRRRLVLAFWPAAIGSAAMAAVVVGARTLLAQAPVWLEFATMVALGGLAYLCVIWLIARRQLLADAKAFAHAQADKEGAEASKPVAA